MSSEQPPEFLLRVTNIEIAGLFGRANYRITLNPTERVTVLHGLNGVGKTATLFLVAALLEGKYTRLLRYPFRRLRVDLGGEFFLEVIETLQNGNRYLGLRYQLPSGQLSLSNLRFSRLDDEMSQFGQQLKRIATDRWLWTPTGEKLSTDELLARFPMFAISEVLNVPSEILSYHERSRVHFIETQRLFTLHPPRDKDNSAAASLTATVDLIGGDIVNRTQEVNSQYRETSLRLDNSLPARLFAPVAAASAPSEEELSRRARALEDERFRLRTIGLVDNTAGFNLSILNPTQRAMFEVYLQDNEEKLRVFKDLADRVELMLGIINRKFLHKQLIFDKAMGYRIISDDKQSLSLDALSSGEQHELVLLHSFLFRTAPGTLVLIDEPELSLHVVWQSEFLADLLKIVKVVGVDAVVATHSPYIVGTRRDLMVQLGDTT